MANEGSAFLEGFTDGPIPDKTMGELQAAFGERDMRFDAVLVRTHALGTDVIGDASWTEFNDNDSNRVARKVSRTFMFFHRPETTLPEFSIQAKRGVAGRFLLGVASRLMGVPGIELPDEPEFNEKFTVITANPESVRVLLVRDLIDALVAIEDVNMSFVSRGLLFTRHPGVFRGTSLSMSDRQDERLRGKDRTRFVEDAVTCSAPVVDDPDSGRRAADAVEGTFAEEAYRNMTESGGLAGRAVKKMMVTQAMLDILEHATTPRQEIPGPVRRRAWGGLNFPLAILGTLAPIFLTVGLVVGFGGGSGADGPWWILLLVSLLLFLIFAFVFMHRQVRKRIIDSGRIVPGRIIAVEETDTSVNDDVIHRIIVQPDAGGEEPITAKMGSEPAKSARRMMDDGTPTWVLVDPKKPGRGLWPHGWSLDSRAD